MEKITENYVSFETAKLLKEKGFPQQQEYALAMYNEEGVFHSLSTSSHFYYDYNDFDEKDCIAVTQSLAMRWLREVHNLSIAPYRTACGYLYTIDRIPTGSALFSAQYEGDDEDSGQFTTWEKAVEHAIKYCLENLI